MDKDEHNNLFPEVNSSEEAPQPFAATTHFQTEEETNSPEEANEVPEFPEIQWSASEAIDHNHSGKWNLVLVLITLAILAILAVLVVFNIFQIVSAISTGVMVIAMVAAIFVVSKRPAREINYILNGNGVVIDGIIHPFAEYRAFSVRQIGAMWELVLIPVKRFGLGNTMFIHEDQGEEIVDILGERMPMEESAENFVDKLIKIIKL